MTYWFVWYSFASIIWEVLVITHEKARTADMDDYFAKKFHPLQVLYVIGRSYKMSPECTPWVTLYDAWKELPCPRYVSVTLTQFSTPHVVFCLPLPLSGPLPLYRVSKAFVPPIPSLTMLLRNSPATPLPDASTTLRSRFPYSSHPHSMLMVTLSSSVSHSFVFTDSSPQEVVIPMMMDARFPADTLFLLFEEDYRFWPQGEDPDGADDYKARLSTLQEERKRSRSPNKMKRRPQEALEPTAQTEGQASSSSSGAYRPDAKGAEKGKKIVTGHHYTPARGSTVAGDLNDGLSPNVADLLRMATFCTRKEMGEVIWFGWCCADNNYKPAWPVMGSHGLMMTKKGAMELRMAMVSGKIKRGHIDLELLRWLRQKDVAADLKACYIFPSVGGFFQHPSGCDPKRFPEDSEGRPAGFTKKSSSRGTRVSDDTAGHRAKYIAQWGACSDGRQRIFIPFPSDADLHSPKYRWTSYREDEPTASSKQGSPVNPPKEWLTQRGQRLKRQFEAREKLRTLVGSPLEAAHPSSLLHVPNPIASPQNIPSNTTPPPDPTECIASPSLYSPGPSPDFDTPPDIQSHNSKGDSEPTA